MKRCPLATQHVGQRRRSVINKAETAPNWDSGSAADVQVGYPGVVRQLIQAVQKKVRKKANALAEKIAESYKNMGPEFAALIDIEKHVDLNSQDGKEIASIVASLGESCGGQ